MELQNISEHRQAAQRRRVELTSLEGLGFLSYRRRGKKEYDFSGVRVMIRGK